MVGGGWSWFQVGAWFSNTLMFSRFSELKVA